MPPRLNGQWVGTYEGSTQGTIVVNIDNLDSCYEGEAFLTDGESGAGLVAFFTTKDKNAKFDCRTDSILWLDVGSGKFVPPEQIASKFVAGTVFSKFADVEGEVDEGLLRLSWKTDIGTAGSCVLPRSKASKPSELSTRNMDWKAYKEYVSSLTLKRHLFRGQTSPFRLRTSYHRSGRAHLHRFLTKDIVELHKHLSGKTRHFFNLLVPDENGAFFNLVQHHGYPTPLLDWSYSPYVAAFFAYHRISTEKAETSEANAKVRILVFDQAQWRKDWNQVSVLILPGLHVSIGEFVAVENERLIPQQAASTITNADDIEQYIQSKETELKE